MMIVWNEQSVRWFRDASAYTGYHRKLAQILLSHMPSRASLCDIGCGAAQIDFELAKFVEHVTCIDISPEVIRAVEQQAQEQQVTNLTARCMDGAKAQGEWETVLALFHGGGDVVEKYLPLAKDQLILVTHGSLVGGFGPKGRQPVKCFDAGGIRSYLDEKGVKYHLQLEQLEYGQPFADMEDARAFVKAYCKPMEPEELEGYLREKLEHTGDSRFPYYLPKKKDLGIFVIRRDENAQL